MVRAVKSPAVTSVEPEKAPGDTAAGSAGLCAAAPAAGRVGAACAAPRSSWLSSTPAPRGATKVRAAWRAKQSPAAAAAPRNNAERVRAIAAFAKEMIGC